MLEPVLIAVDWGTTSFRAWLLGSEGAVMGEITSAHDGSRRVSDGCTTPQARAAAFDAALTRLCGQWLAAHPGLPVIASGMVGSNHGWVTAPYLDVPTSTAALAQHLTRAPSSAADVWIVPGVRATSPLDDVMRGEETQIAGIIASATNPPDLIVLPGTHSKWAWLDGDTITGFSTTMTGEAYALLANQSILSQLAGEPVTGESVVSESEPAAGPQASDAFNRGLDTDRDYGAAYGLTSLIFTARTAVMAGRLAPSEVRDYLSGLLIGHEIRHALGRTRDAHTIALCGAPALTQRYRIALEGYGVTVQLFDDTATIAGLAQVAETAGLIPSPTDGQLPVAPSTSPSLSSSRMEFSR
jgi:2-dehydro-3-deoxygalactonokinase